MPIAVRVVSDQEYATWLDGAKKKYAESNQPNPNMIAAVDKPAQ